jgi:hypothetical protein
METKWMDLAKKMAEAARAGLAMERGRDPNLGSVQALLSAVI